MARSQSVRVLTPFIVLKVLTFSLFSNCIVDGRRAITVSTKANDVLLSMLMLKAGW